MNSPVNRRSDFRVNISMPVRWQVLKEKEIKLVKKGLGSTFLKQDDLPSPIVDYLEQIAQGSKEEQLYQALQYINNKLDFIIEQTLLKSTESLMRHDKIIEISASGLKFETNKHIDVGAYLKMNIIMPGTIQYQIHFIAKAVRIEEKDENIIIAVNIIYIDEDAKDSMIKVIFQKQRKDIRTNKIKQEEINAV